MGLFNFFHRKKEDKKEADKKVSTSNSILFRRIFSPKNLRMILHPRHRMETRKEKGSISFFFFLRKTMKHVGMKMRL